MIKEEIGINIDLIYKKILKINRVLVYSDEEQGDD